MKETVEKLQTELVRIKGETRKFGEIFKHSNTCPTCGEPILPGFKVCPFCGENTSLLPETIITNSNNLLSDLMGLT